MGSHESVLELIKQGWKRFRLIDIRVGEIEDLIADLKAKGKKPATVNRYLALLRHMFNWAVGREYLDRTPFRRGNQALIKFERENKRRNPQGEPGGGTTIDGRRECDCQAVDRRSVGYRLA